MFLVLQNGKSEAEELVLSHYVICNDTHETLRFGQVDTDENVLLASLHSHQYSWRSHKSPQVKHAATPAQAHTHSFQKSWDPEIADGPELCGFCWTISYIPIHRSTPV